MPHFVEAFVKPLQEVLTTKENMDKTEPLLIAVIDHFTKLFPNYRHQFSRLSCNNKCLNSYTDQLNLPL